jgi:hypothetical protein
MNKRSMVFGAALLALAAAGCSKKASDAKSDPPAAKADDKAPAAPAKADDKPAAPAKAKSCADYGGTGTGTFQDMCKLKGPAPFDVVVTADYKDDFGKERPDIKITNKTDHKVEWVTMAVYYYDKDGKLLHQKTDDGGDMGVADQASGGGIVEADAGETIDIGLGPKKGNEPEGAVKKEAEILAWGWNGPEGNDKGGMFFSAHAEQPDLDVEKRPMGGWK